MIKKVLLVLVIVVTSLVTAQTGATQDQQAAQHPDLRLEHADVPMYPQLARTARILGTVEVQVTVKDGKVVSADVKSGPPVLARATVENIQTWRFYRLVNATFTTKFIYQLETRETLDPQNPKVELQLPLLAKITAVPVHLDTR
jgi:outer membrane biosynthesis protein TonB